jgi:hypothetical protein
MMGILGGQDETVLSAISAEVETEIQTFLLESGILRFPIGNHHV